MSTSGQPHQGGEQGRGKASERQSRGDEADLDLSIYLRELRRAPLLTAEQEVALAQQVEAGRAARDSIPDPDDPEGRAEREAIIRTGDAAYRTLVESNLRLVVSVARRFTGRGVDFVDLIQEGNLGLYRAVAKYDWRRGTRFSTYATWWIRQAIHRSLVNQGRLIRLPAHVDGELTHAQHALQELEQELGRAPAPAERRERLGPSERKLVAHAGVVDRPISLEASVTDDASLADMLPDTSANDPSEIVERRLIASGLDDALGQALEPREAQVLRLRFGLGGLRESSLVEIGAALGMSRERARQIEVVALRKLRRSTVVQRQFGIEAS